MNETLIGCLLAGLLVLVGGLYGRKQIRVLMNTTPYHEMLPDERQYLRRQAWRRLVNSGLMLLLAALIAGSYALGLQQKADDLGDKRQRERAEGKPIDPADRHFGRFYGGYWIATLSLLGVIVAVAGLDLMATRRYALRQLTQIQNDRRAMIARQMERYRQERGEFGASEET